MKTLISLWLAILLLFPNHGVAQEPSEPAPPAAPAPASPGGTSATNTGSSSSRTKNRLIPSYLILGTVFNENALSFPGVQVRIRRSGEKKFLVDTYTNSRGEFAARVPPGYEYEVLVRAKNCEDRTETVDSTVDVQQRLSIKMQPKGQPKTGGKQ
jgi:Carboxypeptidase regulatory-like domain